MKPLGLAFQYFTRLPSPQFEFVNDEEMGDALTWLPFVGLVIGLVIWIVTLLDGFIPTEVVAAMILAFWVWVTGALHIDGAADFADAWLGSCGDQQKALEILKDSRIGTAGGVAIGLILLFKWLLLVELLKADMAIWLLMIPVFARVGSLMLMISGPYAKTNSSTENVFSYLNRNFVWAWFGVVGLIALLGAPILLLLIFLWLAIRAQVMKTLGGVNGDSAGMQTEVIEIAALFLLAISA